MFDLNDDKQFGGIQIFNDGEAGFTKNVTISVERREIGEPETYPDYKLIVKDNAGAMINQGFYYFKPNPQADSDHNKKRETQEVGRVLHIAKAVLGKDYKFPPVNSSKEAFDVLFKLVEDNCQGKQFNVYTTYGNVNRPSLYLGLRYFSFIEPAGMQEGTTLKANPNDVLERIEPDKDPSQDELSEVTKQAIDEL